MYEVSVIYHATCSMGSCDNSAVKTDIPERDFLNECIKNGWRFQQTTLKHNNEDRETILAYCKEHEYETDPEEEIKPCPRCDGYMTVFLKEDVWTCQKCGAKQISGPQKDFGDCYKPVEEEMVEGSTPEDSDHDNKFP